MSDLIDIPATAQAALDAGVMYTIAFELTLPAAQSADGAGEPWRYIAWHRSITYGGETFVAADSPLLRFAWSDAKQDAEGRAAVEFADPLGVWEGRFTAAGMRGNAAVLHTLLPHGNNMWWPMETFRAETDSIERLQDSQRGRVLKILCEDQMFRAKFVPGEWTTDGYQRKLSAEKGQTPQDNSHIIAGIARTKRWHTR